MVGLDSNPALDLETNCLQVMLIWHNTPVLAVTPSQNSENPLSPANLERLAPAFQRLTKEDTGMRGNTPPTQKAQTGQLGKHDV